MAKITAERNWLVDAAAYSGCPADKIICPDVDSCQAHGDGGESHQVRRDCWQKWAKKETVAE